ncbi:MAG TPA: hypothetical protein VFH80_00965 [Solirubrobacteraceae bacterium]|nr:hypothetical protein [Solirubrobacteraceae bacterium]
MIRPAVIAVPLLGVFTAGALTALTYTATQPQPKADNQICIVLAKDANHQHTQDYCIDWGSVIGR